MVSIGYLSDQDTVVRLAAVLEQDLVNFPNGCDDCIVALSRLQDLLQEFEKANRIDE